jgi:hypothetical protein
MMEFTLSKHVEDTMRERGIDFAWLAATMDAPETIEQHPDDPTLNLCISPHPGIRQPCFESGLQSDENTAAYRDGLF